MQLLAVTEGQTAFACLLYGGRHEAIWTRHTYQTHSHAYGKGLFISFSIL